MGKHTELHTELHTEVHFEALTKALFGWYMEAHTEAYMGFHIEKCQNAGYFGGGRCCHWRDSPGFL